MYYSKFRIPYRDNLGFVFFLLSISTMGKINYNFLSKEYCTVMCLYLTLLIFTVF